MSSRARLTYVIFCLFVLLLTPVYADSSAQSQTSGSQSPAAANPQATKPGEESTPPAAAEPDSTRPPDQDQGAISVPGTVGGNKVVVLKPGEKIPERKHPEYEDWGTPYVPKTMKGEERVLAKGDRATFTRELVSVQWREMDPIDLHVIRPKGVQKPPVILYLYGFPANNARYKDDNFCEALTKNGFAAVGFVSAVTGQRFHDRAGREWFVSELPEALGATVHDVQQILNYLERRGDFDMSRIGIWANGSGAAIAIMAAAVDPRIKVLDLLNPWGDWPDWLAKSSIVPEVERPNYLKPFFLGTVKGLDPVDWLPQLKDRQVRLEFISDGMTVTPPEVKQRIEKAAPSNVEIVHYQNAQEFAQKIDAGAGRFDWVQRQVGKLSEVREASNPASPDKDKEKKARQP